jgi:plasmid replication initiation protein
MDAAAVQSWQKQPEEKAVVWQHNRLAEARYELTAREQKLLLYVIAMIEPEDEDFKRYIINIGEFAQLANLDKDHLYRELRELAKSLKQKPLIIPNHFDAQTGTYLDLVTSWFDTAYVGRNGAGYFAVTISQVLKPYLLQVKREFFRFRLFHVMQLRSSYAIRLYQWAKRWEFRKNMEISVQELRNVLGANNGRQDGQGTKLNLGAYADFKRRAINPAVGEINEKTDLIVSYRELKAKGSKAVERLAFLIRADIGQQLELVQPSPPPQLEFGLEIPLEQQELVREFAEQYGLNDQQKTAVEKYYSERGEAYVLEKVSIVDQEPRENSARAFLAALRDDWKPKVKITKVRKTPRPNLEAVPEERAAEELGKKVAEGLRGFRQAATGFA